MDIHQRDLATYKSQITLTVLAYYFLKIMDEFA